MRMVMSWVWGCEGEGMVGVCNLVVVVVSIECGCGGLFGGQILVVLWEGFIGEWRLGFLWVRGLESYQI